MKKLFKNSILMLAVLLFGFSSCNSDDIPIIDTSDYKTLSLRISSNVATRGISESVADGTPVVFNTGTLFLVNSDGVIVRHYNIVPRGQATIGTNISRSDFDSQVTIDNIPGQVVEAVVVANTTGNNTAGTINAVGERVIDIVAQYDVTNVNLFGRAMFQPTGFIHPTTGNNVHEANILLRPTVARFEIADITGAGQIESFTIEGIFIDRYYREAQVAGGVLTHIDNFVDNGQDADLFVHGSTAYPAALTPALFDWGAWSGSRSASLTVSPDNAGNVWAYQLFAQTDASADATTVPHIVIRMNNITLRNGTQIQGARFLTIRGIYTQNGVLEGIRAGIVYRFPAGEIVFTEQDLSPRPNENPIDARVMVLLSNWNEEAMRLPFRQVNPLCVVTCFQSSMLTAGQGNSGGFTGMATSVYFDIGEALGGSGDFSYQWQQSLDGTNWTDIENNATAQSTNLRLLTIMTRGNVYSFRRIVTDNVSGEVLTSAAATVSEPAPTLTMPDYVTMNGVTVSTRNLYMPGVFMERPFVPGLFYRPGNAIPYQVRSVVRDNTGAGVTSWGHYVRNYIRGFYGGEWGEWERDGIWVENGVLNSGVWTSNFNTAIPVWHSSRNPCPAGWRMPNIRSGEIDLFFEGFTRSRTFEWHQAQAAGCGCNAGTLWEDDNGVVFFSEQPNLFLNWTNSQRLAWQWSNGLNSTSMSYGGTGHARMVRCVKDVLTPLREVELCKDTHFSWNGTAVSIGNIFNVLRVLGELGTYEYQWQQSLDGVNWSNVTWAQGQGRTEHLWFSMNNLLPQANFTSDRYFRRVTTSLPSGNRLISNAILITMSDIGR